MLPLSTNPQQIYEILDNIVFNSCFDSGNLGKVQKIAPSHYELFISPDCAGTPKENKYKTWFHFSVGKVPKDITLTFTIKNMNFQGKLFREGMLPVYRNTQMSHWRRIKHPIVSLETTDKGLEVTFKHTFETNNDIVFFAFTYPWSYSDNLEFLDYLHEKVPPFVYFHRDTIAFSRENRKIELLTISSYKGLCESEEKTIPNLFPTENPRAKRFENKPYVLITARVHPGENPGSFVLNGLLKYLCLPKSTDFNCMNLLDNFVFVIIPMLNPDGVYKGHYRTDPQGLNLNRFYVNPSHIEHPSIYAVKELAIYLDKRLYMYVDLHAHASKKGCFIFGNSLDYKNQVDICLFPKLLGMNSRNFDYENCDFSQKNMFAKEKGDEFSKEGCGRVGIYKATGVLYSYTLECNYNIGIHGPEVDEIEEKKLQEVWLGNKNDMNLEDSRTLEFIMGNEIKKIDYLEASPYTIEAYEDIGKGICLSLLDLNDLNCEVPKNLRILKMNLAANLLKKAPFRFEPALRKIMRALTNPNEMKKALKEIVGLIEKNRKNSENKQKVEKEKLAIVAKNITNNANGGGLKAAQMKIININFDEKKNKLVKKVSSSSGTTGKTSATLPPIFARKLKAASLKNI